MMMSSNILFKSFTPFLNYDHTIVSSARFYSDSHTTNGPRRINENDNINSHNTEKEVIEELESKGTNAMKRGVSSLRDLFQLYGWTFVGTYLGVYVVTLGSFFVGLDSGVFDSSTVEIIHFPWPSFSGSGEEDGDAIVNTMVTDGIPTTMEMARDSTGEASGTSPVDWITSYLEHCEFTSSYVEMMKRNPHVSNLAVAWAVTKLTEPLRMIFTLAIVPRIHRFWNKRVK